MNENGLKVTSSRPVRSQKATSTCIALILVTLLGYRGNARAQDTSASSVKAHPSIESPAPASNDVEAANANLVTASEVEKEPESPHGNEQPREPGRRWLPGISPTLPTEDEWAEIGGFMEQHSPVRWTLAQRSLSQPGRSELPRRVIFAQYLELKKLQVAEPAEYKQRVGQIELEDEIFQAESALRDAEAKQSADVSDLRSAFELKVKEHFDRELDAKEARIGRLESQLRQQRAALESEKRKASQMLQQRIEIARKLSDWFRGWASGTVSLPFPRRGPRQDESKPGVPSERTPAPDPTPAK